MPLLKTDEILAENNVRHSLNDAGIKDLAISIITVHRLSNGEKSLLQPIVVQKLKKKTAEGHTHQLRYGFRRLAAMRYLAETYPEKCFWAKQVPVIVDEAVYNEEEGSLKNFQLIENIQREDMTLLEEAVTMQRIMKEDGLNQSELATTLGKSKGWVSQRLALLKMDEAIQLGVQEGKFGQAHVRELARIKKKKDQSAVAAKLLKEKKPASVEQVRRAVNKSVGPTAPKANAKPKTEKTPAPKKETPAETPDNQLDLSGTQTARTVSEPSLEESPPTRGELLKAMPHDEKLAFLKGDADARQQDADTKAIALGKEVVALNKKSAAARKKGDADAAAFFDGAAQALKFALGSVKSIKYVQKKAAS
jgi:ParB/RepB/Spo0J family partition protein